MNKLTLAEATANYEAAANRLREAANDVEKAKVVLATLSRADADERAAKLQAAGQLELKRRADAHAACEASRQVQWQPSIQRGVRLV